MVFLPTNKEKIFPHQVSCVALIYHTSKHDTEHELSILCKQWRCSVVLLVLSLIQKIHLDYEALLAKLEAATSKSFVDVFNDRMLNVIDSKYMGLLDLFDSLEHLTVSGNHYVYRTSIFGLFIRRIYLQYQKMSFSDIGDLGKSIEAYLQSSRVDVAQGSSSLDMQVSQGSVEREVVRDRIVSLLEVDRFIANQTRLLESQGTNALPPRELHEKLQEIIHKFPSMIDAYYLSYLNHLQVGELRSALFDLHRYFDYKKWDDDQIGSESERTLLEKHQFKFKRFRYCALTLGVFHFHHEHYEIAHAALEEAIRMAQETNDSHCLLHAMFWLHQLKLERDPKLANSLLAQLNKKAKELGAVDFQILGSLQHCKIGAFGGNATFRGTLERLKEIDCACAVKVGYAAGKIEIAKSALFDFYGYRSISSITSQMVLFYLQNRGDVLSDQALINDRSDPESSILAVCQLARCLADDGFFTETEKILKFGTSLIPEHSNLHKWLCICKWQLFFERSVLARDLKSAEEAINYLKLYDIEDAKFRSCVLEYLLGNFSSASAKVDIMLGDAEARLHSCVGYTPGAPHFIRLLQLKAELYASSSEFSKALTCLTNATDVCRRFGMKTMEAEIAISMSHCMIFLGLPRHAKQTISEHMIRILSNGTLYAKSMAFLIYAKTTLFSSKEDIHDFKSEMLQLLSPLERSLQGCQLLGASAARMELLCLMAHIYHILEYNSKRNMFAKEFRLIHEESPVKHPVKLLI